VLTALDIDGLQRRLVPGIESRDSLRVHPSGDPAHFGGFSTPVATATRAKNSSKSSRTARLHSPGCEPRFSSSVRISSVPGAGVVSVDALASTTMRG
jgi:hypothetical protein